MLGLRQRIGRTSVLDVASFLVLSTAIYGYSGYFSVPQQLYYVQSTSTAWVRSDPVETILNLHTQPPLFNLIRAAIPDTAFALSWWCIGKVCVGVLLWSCLQLQRELGRPNGLTRAITIGVFLLPPIASLQLVPMYVMWCAPALSTLALVLIRCRTRPPQEFWTNLAVASVLTSILALSWSLFHPVWVIGMVALMAAMAVRMRRVLPRPRTGQWSALAVGGCLMMIFVGFLFNNWHRFGVVGLSSFSGSNLSRITVERLSPEQRQAMFDNGELTETAMVGKSVWAWQTDPNYCRDHQLPAIAVLCEAEKLPNFQNPNHISLVPRYRDATSDAVAALKRHPELWARQLPLTFGDYLRAPEQSSHSFEVAEGTPEWMSSLGDLVYLRWEDPPPEYSPGWTSGHLRSTDFTWLGAIGLSTVLLLTVVRRHRGRIVMLILLGVIGWTVVMPNLVEYGENRRFRQLAEAPVMALVIVSIAGAHQRDSTPRSTAS